MVIISSIHVATSATCIQRLYNDVPSTSTFDVFTTLKLRRRPNPTSLQRRVVDVEGTSKLDVGTTLKFRSPSRYDVVKRHIVDVVRISALYRYNSFVPAGLTPAVGELVPRPEVSTAVARFVLMTVVVDSWSL